MNCPRMLPRATGQNRAGAGPAEAGAFARSKSMLTRRCAARPGMCRRSCTAHQLAWPSWPVAADTFSASARDWSAAWLAPVTLIETSLVPVAACWTLRAISRVAQSCCSYGGGNGGGDPADLADGVADAPDGGHAVAGGGLDRGHLSCEFSKGRR